MKFFRRISLSLLVLVMSITSVMAISSVTSAKKSNDNTVYAATRDEKIEKAIARAEYILNFRWTAVASFTGWGYTFTKGNSYTIPYGQPYNHGGYLFYNITLAQFEAGAKNANSNVYRHDDVGGGAYWALDCSAFASFCLGVTTRCTTYTFETWANNSSNGFYYKSFSTVAKGDLLNSNSVGHVLVVGKVDGNNVSCYESTPQYRKGRADICYTTKTKTEWQNIGYKVVGYDYRGTGAPKDDVTERLASAKKDNSVLGGCLDSAYDTTWNVTKDYNANSANFANREVTLTSSNGAENAIYFTQTNETHQVIEADFTVTGKTSAELYGKFGLAFVDKTGKGFLFYCNASGTTGTAVSNVTGTGVGIVGRTADSTYTWGSEVEKTDAWNPAQKVTLKIERIGGYYKCYVNGVLAFEGVMSSYGIDTNQEVYPSIRSFNVYLKVKNYSQTATVNSITLDGDLSDWKTNENWGKISADKKSVADSSNANKKVEFYHRLTDEGLFIYAEAHHAKTTSGADDWWENTNFEMFINSDAVSAQFYASEGVVEGFKAFCFKTTGSDGNYVTILEGFIDNATLKSKAGYKGSSLKIGYAFKIDNGTVADEITPSGGEATSYWCAGNSEPRNVAYTVTKEASYASGYSYTANNIGNWTFNGTKLTLSSCTSGKDDTIYFKDNVTTKHEFSATFKITGKESSELYGKIGIAYIDDYGDGFFFYADASGTTGTGVANVTGTTFGLVYSNEGSYLWSNAKSKTLTGATFAAGQEFTLKVVRQDNSATLYANDVSLATISYSDYTINNNKNVYPSIMSFNIRAEVTNAGIKNVQQGGIKFDGDLSDWKALDNWEKINAKKVGVYDSATTGKGVTFYTLLNEEGLFIAAEAKHAKTTFGYADWWKNTNIECFIGQSDMEHQFYATKSIRKGWNKSELVTTGTSGNYTTIFEGFISKEYLTNVLCMNANEIKIGYAFKVDNLGTVSDTITPTGGTATSYWCVGKDPLALNNVIKASDYVDQDRTVTVEKVSNGSVTPDKTTAKVGTKITLTIKANDGYSVGSIEVKTASGKSVTLSGNTFTMPDENVTVKVTFNKNATTSSSSSKADSSKPNSSSSQESSKPSSSTVDSSVPDSSKPTSSKPTSSVTPDSSKPTSSAASSSIAAPETPSSSKGGCNGSVSTTLTVLLPLALIAVIVFIKKSKEQR